MSEETVVKEDAARRPASVQHPSYSALGDRARWDQRQRGSVSRFRQSMTAADVWGALTRFRVGGADSDPWSRARLPPAVETYDFHLGSSLSGLPRDQNGGRG